MRIVVTNAGEIEFYRHPKKAEEAAIMYDGVVIASWRNIDGKTTYYPHSSDVMRGYRTASGLTQAQAADEFGVTRNTWARWERGEVIPSETALILLAERSGLFEDGGE